MPRSAISASSNSNQLSACIHVVLKPYFRYILLTFLVLSSVLFTFRFFHTSHGKHNLSEYGFQKSNAVDVHDVTEQDDFLVYIKYSLEKNWLYDRFHLLDLVVNGFSLQMWHTGSIDVLSHHDVFSHNQEILQDFVINRMQGFIYWLAGDVLELPCAIIPVYITGGDLDIGISYQSYIQVGNLKVGSIPQ